MPRTDTDRTDDSDLLSPLEDQAASRPRDAVPYMDRTRELYASQRPYQWLVHDRETEPPPWTPIEGTLEEKRVVLISTGGVYHAEQESFHVRNDVSHREIPIDTPSTDLRVAHFGYDTSDAKSDPACVLPLRALRELAAAGEIRSVVDRALSFMGGIYSQRLVREEVAPRFRDFVLGERADLVLLVPV
jgi:D-proline reductase (dithiol) PrdB